MICFHDKKAFGFDSPSTFVSRSKRINTAKSCKGFTLACQTHVEADPDHDPGFLSKTN